MFHSDQASTTKKGTGVEAAGETVAAALASKSSATTEPVHQASLKKKRPCSIKFAGSF